MHFFTQAALGADAKAVSDDQHPDHQFGIDRRSADIAVERPQMRAQAGQVDETIKRAQQVVARDMAFEAELVNSASCITVRSPIIDESSNSKED